MEKTLYLSENEKLRIKCDGASLWIQQPDRAAQRVPARLVCRAIVIGNVTLDTASLTLLAQRGVPITLSDRHGEPVAMLLGVDDGTRPRRARQAALSENPDKRERIIAWLDAWQRGRQLRLAKDIAPIQAQRWRRTGFRRTDYEEWILAQGRARECHLRERAFLNGALLELIAAEVTAQGWDPHTGVRDRGTTLGFVKDCFSALHADGDRIWIMLPNAAARARPLAARVLAERFESARTRLEARLCVMLEQYARILWEI